MKYILIIILIISSISIKAQFTGTDSLRNYNNRYITNNPATSFTNLRLNTLLRGIIDFIDTARAGGSGGSIALGIDTVFAVNDSTIRYRKNGVFRQFTLKGVYDSRRKVDTIYKSNDTTLTFTINGQLRTVIIPGGTNLNLATANQTATGNRTHNWNDKWLFINNIKALDLNTDHFDPNHPDNRFKAQFAIDSTIDTYPARLTWGLKNINDDFSDSMHFEFTSQKHVSYLYHYIDGGSKLVEMDWIPFAFYPHVDIYANGNGKYGYYSFGASTAEIHPQDSVLVLAVPAANADSVLGVRALNNGINTIVKFPKSAIGGTGSTTLNNVGTGLSWATTPNGSVKKFNPTYGLTGDSATSNTISLKVDTSSTNHIVTQSDLNDGLATKQATGSYITATTGDVDITGPGSVTATIANNVVSDAKIRQSSGLSIIGRSANSTGNVADITAGTDNQVLRRNGTSIGFGAINLSSSNAVTGNLPIANLSITGTPDGTKFLRDDGAWATPAGGGGSPGGSDENVQVNSSGSFAGYNFFKYNNTNKRVSIFGTSTADLSHLNDHNLKVIGNRIYLGDTTSGEPTFIEFGNPYGSINNSPMRMNLGWSGTEEFNIWVNAHYRNQLHTPYDPTKRAQWIAMNTHYFLMQAQGIGYDWDDNNGSKVTWRFDNLEDGNAVVGGRLTTNEYYIADRATTDYNQSIGRAARMIMGGATLRFSGVPDYEFVDSANIGIGTSVNTSYRLSLKTSGTKMPMLLWNDNNDASNMLNRFDRSKLGSHTLTAGTKVGFDVNSVAGFYFKATSDAPGGFSSFDGVVSTQNAAGTIAERFFHGQNGDFRIGASSEDATAILNISSTTRGVLFPRMNTTQQNAISSPTTGLMIVNTDSITTSPLRMYNGTSWVAVASGAGGGGASYTFQNGIGSSGTTVEWGASALGHDTKLDLNNNLFRIVDGSNVQVKMFATGETNITKQLIIGDSTANDGNNLFELHKVGANTRMGMINEDNSTNTNTFQFLKNRAMSYDLTDGDVIGEFNYNTLGSFKAIAGGTSSGGFKPFHFTWATTNDAGATAERMRFTNNGYLLIGTTSDDGVSKLLVNGRITATSTPSNFSGTIDATAKSAFDVVFGVFGKDSSTASSGNGAGVRGFSLNGSGVFGEGPYGVTGYTLGKSTTNISAGVRGISDNNITAPALAGIVNGLFASPNDTLAALDLYRTYRTSMTAGGSKIRFFAPRVSASVMKDSTLANTIQSVITNISGPSYTTKLFITGKKDSVENQLISFNGDGQIQENKYGQGTFSVTPATTPVYSSTGVIGERIAPKIYTALLTQSGSGAPTATVLGTNEIGSIVWTRNGAGSYTGTLSGAFTANKTWLMVQRGDQAGTFVNNILSWSSANALLLTVQDNGATPTDNFTNMSIRIEVYP